MITSTKKIKKSFNGIFNEYVDKYSKFYLVSCTAVNALEDLGAVVFGHGITLGIRPSNKESSIDDYLKESRPYNGVSHTIYDTNIIDTLHENRENDLATIVDVDGNIIGKNVGLLMDPIGYKIRHGINSTLSEYLGFDDTEDAPGARNISALTMSDVSDILLVTLSDNQDRKSKGTVNAYYKGLRIYSQVDRNMRCDLASNPPILEKYLDTVECDFDTMNKAVNF